MQVKIEKSIFTGFCGRDSKTFDKFQEKVKEICKEELKTIGEMKSQLQSSIKKARQKSNSTKTGDGNDNKSPTTAVAAGEAPVEEEAELDDDGNPLEKLVNCVSRKRANHAGHDQSKRSKTSFTGINSMVR